MANQSGKVSNPSAPPFATKDGETTNDDKATGNDFTRNPQGNGDKSGGSHVPQSRKQAVGDIKPADAPWLRSRPQPSGSAAQRVNPQSIPAGGITTKADPGAAARAIGAQSAPRPFKGMK